MVITRKPVRCLCTLALMAGLMLLAATAAFAATNADSKQDKIYWQDKVAVLLYHEVDANANSSAIITPESFASHLDMLQQEGYNVISLEQMDLFLQGQATVPPNAVAITFDDGYQGVYDHAYPLLLERNMPAAVFIIVGKVGQNADQRLKLSWEGMQELSSNGISMQSHSYDGHRYAVVNKNGTTKPVLVAPLYNGKNYETRQEYLQRVYLDLLTSKTDLERRLGQPVNYFAAPYGWVNRDLKNIAKFAGYSYIFTTKPGLNDRNTPANQLYRINAGSPWITADSLKQKLQALIK